MANPPPLVRFTLECLAILLEERTEWDMIKRQLTDVNYLTRLKTLKVKNLSNDTVNKV
jgi:dynein heavy chain